jgi:hypothetical protein
MMKCNGHVTRMGEESTKTRFEKKLKKGEN